jgi:hypothetical protein
MFARDGLVGINGLKKKIKNWSKTGVIACRRQRRPHIFKVE